QFLPLIAVKSQFTHELLVPRSLLGLALDLFQNDGIGEHENQLLAPKLLAASKTLSPPSTRSPRENVFQFSSLRTRRPVRFKAFKLKDIRIRRFLRLCPQVLPGNPRQNPESAPEPGNAQSIPIFHNTLAPLESRISMATE